jgi:Cysteine rich repeat
MRGDRALTSRAEQTFIPAHCRDEGVFGMLKVFCLLVSALIAAQIVSISLASAQQSHDACVRDVSRFCRARMNDGDSVVLECLKQHRSRLSRACDKVLTDNGQ